jgi:hypothetical protein
MTKNFFLFYQPKHKRVALMVAHRLKRNNEQAWCQYATLLAMPLTSKELTGLSDSVLMAQTPKPSLGERHVCPNPCRIATRRGAQMRTDRGRKRGSAND